MRHRSRRLLSLVCLALLAAVLVPAPTEAQAPGPDLVISEVMQNPSAVADSAGEWFEVHNPGAVDVDLDGWTVSDNDADSFTVQGSVVVPAGGFAVLGNNADSVTNGGVSVDYQYPSDFFLANGGDELVLVDGSGVEVDRIEWDGGPVWPDPNGASMTLGDLAADNNAGGNWCEATSAFGAGDLGTPGAANDSCGGGEAALPIISEILQNPSVVADSAGEWFEVHNPGVVDVDLAGWTVSDNDIDSFVIDASVVVPAGGYAVLGNNASTGINGGVDVDYQYPSDFFLSNSADEVVLTDSNGVEVDRVEYDGGPVWPNPTGASMTLGDLAADNNVGGNWCGATSAFGAGDLGTPGEANDSCGGPPSAELVISEILQNPSVVGDSVGEWFEVHNPGAVDADLVGWTVSDNDVDSFVIDASVVVPAGGFAVLGNNADSGTNGGVTVDFAYSGFFLSNSADEIVLTDPNGVEVDRVEYDNGATFPDPNGASMSLGDLAADNNVGGNWCEASSTFGSGDRGTPGGANDPCLTLIHEVQGSGPVAALSGQTVTVQGIATALFTRDDVLDGFFLQEEDADVDADPATSEGIFVFCRFGAVCPTSIAAGDLVTVTGVAGEFFGMSQVGTGSGSITIESSGNPLPTPTIVDLPASGRTDAESTFEAVEGMLVTFDDELVISEYFQLARYGQVVLTADARPEQFTDANAPSVAGYSAFLDDLASKRIILDDDNNDQNDATSDAQSDEFSPWPVGGLSTTNLFRGGDSITGLTGVLHWSFAGQSGTDAWRVRPVGGLDYTFTSQNPRPAAPADVGGSLKVASFNVLNYFTTVDEPGALCGPSALGCRGADSPAELDRQRAKIVSALAEIDADIVGLVEIENDEGAATADLVAALNAATAPGTYEAIDTGSIGGDAIKVAMIYQPGSVFPVGEHAVLDSSVDPRFVDDRNRPVLIQTFEQVADGARLTVAVNHLKSKGSPCDDIGDSDAGDGQGNCNLTRTAAAQAMADYLATDPTDSYDGDVLIIGDLNAYAMEDPVTTLEAAGYTDLIEAFEGSSAYSFVFDGQLGYLDHALANGSLASQVTGVTEWHINADEVNLFDYNDEIRDANEASFERESSNASPYGPDAYRSSDHDPVIVGLDLIPTCNGLPATIIGTLGDDNIRGTDGDDVILGRGGNDNIRGGRGDDTICGNQGDDEINGQNEADAIFGGRGDDILVGGARDDVLDGQLGVNSLDGAGGIDTCRNGTAVACEL